MSITSDIKSGLNSENSSDEYEYENIQKKISDKGIIIHANSFQIKHIHNKYKSDIIYEKLFNESDKIGLDEFIKQNKEINEKLEKEVLKILIDIFDRRYEIYPRSFCSLSPEASQMREIIENICSLSSGLSLYMLHLFYSQLKPFFEYMFKKINFKNISEDECKNIKSILKDMGKDINKIIKAALDHFAKTKISNILIAIFDEYYFKELKIPKKKDKNDVFRKEKRRFEAIYDVMNLLSFERDCERILEIKRHFFDDDEDGNNTNDKNVKEIINENESKQKNEKNEKQRK